MRATEPVQPTEQLRLALLDLQQAQRDFVESYAHRADADRAAKHADEARVQAARWAAIVRATELLEE